MGDPRQCLGPRGEQVAADHRAARGYTILDRNVRVRHGKIGLGARLDGLLVFVEVKARRSSRDFFPETAVTRR